MTYSWVLLLVFVPRSVQGTIDSSSYNHVVVVPDLHGDFESTVKSLWLAEKALSPPFVTDYDSFFDHFHNAVFGYEFPDKPVSEAQRVALVTLGDYIDRGPFSEECILTILSVPQVLGWDIFPLYGNHEIMAFLNRSEPYVHKEEIKNFGGLTQRSLEYMIGGEMHEILTTSLLGMAKLEGPTVDTNTLFVHGGIHMEWLSDEDLFTPDIEKFNQRINELVMAEDGLTILNDVDGSFLWTRELANEEDEVVCDELIDPILQAYNVSRIVVGHTPQQSQRGRTRCEGKIFLTDVKISRWMNKWSEDGGQPVAVVFQMDSLTANLAAIDIHYSGEYEDLVTRIYEKSAIGRNGSPSATRLEVLIEAIQESEENKYAVQVTEPPTKRFRLLPPLSTPSLLGRPPLAPKKKEAVPAHPLSVVRGVKFLPDISKVARKPTEDPGDMNKPCFKLDFSMLAARTTMDPDE